MASVRYTFNHFQLLAVIKTTYIKENGYSRPRQEHFLDRALQISHI